VFTDDGVKLLQTFLPRINAIHAHPRDIGLEILRREHSSKWRNFPPHHHS
jgi:hypothetical protein